MCVLRSLYTRVSEHKGLSNQRGKPAVRPKHSNIRDYVMTCGSVITINNFKNVASNNKEIELHIIDSSFIHNDKPLLNDTNLYFPLKLLYFFI